MLAEKYRILRTHLNERALRLCAAADARSLGHGGIIAVSKACKLERNTICAGIREMETEKRTVPDITKLAEQLRQKGHRVSQRTVWNLLKELGYSMQSNRKRQEKSYRQTNDWDYN